MYTYTKINRVAVEMEADSSKYHCSNCRHFVTLQIYADESKTKYKPSCCCMRFIDSIKTVYETKPDYLCEHFLMANR